MMEVFKEDDEKMFSDFFYSISLESFQNCQKHYFYVVSWMTWKVYTHINIPVKRK